MKMKRKLKIRKKKDIRDLHDEENSADQLFKRMYGVKERKTAVLN